MTTKTPLLTLDIAVPDRLPVAITVGDERRVYELRQPAEYSTIERKRLSSLLQGIVEFEQADEAAITDDDVRVYEMALRQVMRIAMPDVPNDVADRLSLAEHGRLAALVVQLFTQTAALPKLTPPEPEAEPVGPARLRRLASRLTLAKSSPGSAASTGDGPPSGLASLSR